MTFSLIYGRARIYVNDLAHGYVQREPLLQLCLNRPGVTQSDEYRHLYLTPIVRGVNTLQCDEHVEHFSAGWSPIKRSGNRTEV